MTFEDLHSYEVPTAYTCTNEEPDLMRRLLTLGKRPIRRAAAIASSGEMVLFTLLPRVQKEVIAVDHSYGSLTAFYVKVLLLESLGPKALRNLIAFGTIADFLKAIETVEAKLPPALLKRAQTMRGGGSPTGYTGIYSAYEFTNIRREWFYASARALAASAKKLDRLTLVHGDLTDLTPRGPFDLLYLSNAHEHAGRQGKKLTQATLDPLLTPNGRVLSANGIFYGKNRDWAWKQLHELRGYRSSWTYNMYQRAGEKVVAKPAKVKA